MKFVCEQCETSFETGNYHDWLCHLVAAKHQTGVRSKLVPKKPKDGWPDQRNTYVITGISAGNGFSPVTFVEWLSTFGIVTEFFYEAQHAFCIVTVQNSAGNPKQTKITGQRTFKSHVVTITPKSEYGPAEWNFVYGGSSGNSKEQSSKANISGGRKSEQPSSQNLSSNTPKHQYDTLVFVNKNVAPRSDAREFIKSNPSIALRSDYTHSAGGRQPEQSSNKGAKQRGLDTSQSFDTVSVSSGTLGGLSDPAVTSLDSPRGKNKRKKSKSSKQQYQQLRENGNCAPSTSQKWQEQPVQSKSTNQASGAVKSPKKSNKQSDKTEETRAWAAHSQGQDFTEVTAAASQAPPQQPTLNFRGGFTYSRKHEISESSDGAAQGKEETGITNSEAEMANQSSSALPQMGGLNLNNNPSSTKPHVQVLKRPADKRAEENRVQDSRTDSFQQSQNNNNTSRSSTGPRIPPQVQQQPKYSGPIRPLMSSVFVNQLPGHRDIATKLLEPRRGGRNPYKFGDNGPPFPYFYEFFDLLLENPMPVAARKVQLEKLTAQYLQFNPEQQVTEFLIAQSLSQDELRLRWQVILDIKYVLQQEYQQCELYAFGSVVTGVGDFSSDIDIYVDLLGESTTPGGARKLTSHEALDAVKRVIKKSECPHTRNRFTKMLVPIKTARVPILKLTHAATNISCDLSFENRLSVQNTRLMLFYLNYDPCVYPLVVLLRYWGKFHRLTGSNYIKNYGLSLLVLVYLVKRQILPPVALLQKLVHEQRLAQRIVKNPFEIDGWDASFCDHLPTINANFRSCQQLSNCPPQLLVDLVIGFFEMYGQLDFSNVVICSLLGDIMPKEQFVPGNEERLPPTLERYKEWAVRQDINRRLNINKHICIQDPFMLSYNVGCVTPLGTVLRFQVACAKTAQTLRDGTTRMSLLKVLIPIPTYVGEKKFTQAYRNLLRTKELKKEIKEAFGEPVNNEDDDVQSTNDYVVLPHHLRTLNGLLGLNEKNLKGAMKSPKWETFVEREMSREFEMLFVIELAKCRIQLSKSAIMEKLCQLWKTFSVDFLKEIFSAMKLEVEQKSVTFDEAVVENESVTLSRYADGKKPWQISGPPPIPGGYSESDRSSDEINILCKKIMEIPAADAKVYYKKLGVTAGYEFWGKRKTEKLNKIAAALEVIEVQLGMKKLDADRKTRRKKASPQPTKQPQPNIVKCINPIDFEIKLAETIWKKEEPGNSPVSVKFDVLVKLDFSFAGDRPYIVFLFDKNSAEQEHTVRALQTLSNILLENFSSYELYRLAKWFNLKTKERSSKEQEEQGKNIPKGASGSGQSVEKKGRSKLEEDLLLPSSSESASDDEVEASNEEADPEEEESEHSEGEEEDANEQAQQ